MNARKLKIEAARTALSHVGNGMRLGIGTGSTAEEFIRLLAASVADGLDIIGVPTSGRTATLCKELGVPLTDLNETPELDLTVDGADEIGPELTLIKGGGGALMREKIVACASARMIVIADESKVVETIGRFPLPIEVDKFGLGATRRAIEKVAEKLGLEGEIKLRMSGSDPMMTDGGHQLLDASFGRIRDARALSSALHEIPGVIEHGIFLDLASLAVIAGADGIRTLDR
jgi:ribose 5-phosphate isomerase A